MDDFDWGIFGAVDCDDIHLPIPVEFGMLLEIGLCGGEEMGFFEGGDGVFGVSVNGGGSGFDFHEHGHAPPAGDEINFPVGGAGVAFEEQIAFFGQVIGRERFPPLTEALSGISQRRSPRGFVFTAGIVPFSSGTQPFFVPPRPFLCPTQGRFLTRDTWQGDYTRPASLHRYTYAENNPVLYTDPSGHFGQIIAGAAIGAAIGGEGNYGYQVYQNRQGGLDWGQSLTCIKWGSVGGWALAGAGVGALAGLALPVAIPWLYSFHSSAFLAGSLSLSTQSILGGGIGGLTSGLGYLGYAKLTRQEINYKSLAVAVGGGIVTGALTPIVSVLAAPKYVALLYGSANAGQYVIDRKVNNQGISLEAGLASFAIGSLGGLIAGAFSPFERRVATNASLLGALAGTNPAEYSKIVNEVLIYQLVNGITT